MFTLPARLFLCLILLSLSLTACSGSDPAAGGALDDVAPALPGRVLTGRIELEPGQVVTSVVFLAPDGAVLETPEVTADDDGFFQFQGALPDSFQIVATTRTSSGVTEIMRSQVVGWDGALVSTNPLTDLIAAYHDAHPDVDLVESARRVGSFLELPPSFNPHADVDWEGDEFSSLTYRQFVRAHGGFSSVSGTPGEGVTDFVAFIDEGMTLNLAGDGPGDGPQARAGITPRTTAESIQAEKEIAELLKTSKDNLVISKEIRTEARGINKTLTSHTAILNEIDAHAKVLRFEGAEGQKYLKELRAWDCKAWVFNAFDILAGAAAIYSLAASLYTHTGDHIHTILKDVEALVKQQQLESRLAGGSLTLQQYGNRIDSIQAALKTLRQGGKVEGVFGDQVTLRTMHKDYFDILVGVSGDGVLTTYYKLLNGDETVYSWPIQESLNAFAEFHALRLFNLGDVLLELATADTTQPVQVQLVALLDEMDAQLNEIDAMIPELPGPNLVYDKSQNLLYYTQVQGPMTFDQATSFAANFRYSGVYAWRLARIKDLKATFGSLDRRDWQSRHNFDFEGGYVATEDDDNTVVAGEPTRLARYYAFFPVSYKSNFDNRTRTYSPGEFPGAYDSRDRVNKWKVSGRSEPFMLVAEVPKNFVPSVQLLARKSGGSMQILPNNADKATGLSGVKAVALVGQQYVDVSHLVRWNSSTELVGVSHSRRTAMQGNPGQTEPLLRSGTILRRSTGQGQPTPKIGATLRPTLIHPDGATLTADFTPGDKASKVSLDWLWADSEPHVSGLQIYPRRIVVKKSQGTSLFVQVARRHRISMRAKGGDPAVSTDANFEDLNVDVPARNAAETIPLANASASDDVRWFPSDNAIRVVPLGNGEFSVTATSLLSGGATQGTLTAVITTNLDGVQMVYRDTIDVVLDASVTDPPIAGGGPPAPPRATLPKFLNGVDIQILRPYGGKIYGPGPANARQTARLELELCAVHVNSFNLSGSRRPHLFSYHNLALDPAAQPFITWKLSPVNDVARQDTSVSISRTGVVTAESDPPGGQVAIFEVQASYSDGQSGGLVTTRITHLPLPK